MAFSFYSGAFGCPALECVQDLSARQSNSETIQDLSFSLKIFLKGSASSSREILLDVPS